MISRQRARYVPAALSSGVERRSDVERNNRPSCFVYGKIKTLTLKRRTMSDRQSELPPITITKADELRLSAS
jgi:hypothetical protein